MPPQPERWGRWKGSRLFLSSFMNQGQKGRERASKQDQGGLGHSGAVCSHCGFSAGPRLGHMWHFLLPRAIGALVIFMKIGDGAGPFPGTP